MFDDELAAQNFTIYHHFLIAGLLPIVNNVLRIISSTEKIGDFLIWIPNLIPSYCLTCGIVSISLKDTIATRRGKSTPDALDADVGGGHLAFLIIHCFFWAILLVCIELGWFNCLRKKGRKIEDEPEELDDDVIKEQQRVENTSESKLAVKADHLRKTYDKNVAVKDVCFALEFGD